MSNDTVLCRLTLMRQANTTVKNQCIKAGQTKFNQHGSHTVIHRVAKEQFHTFNITWAKLRNGCYIISLPQCHPIKTNTKWAKQSNPTGTQHILNLRLSIFFLVAYLLTSKCSTWSQSVVFTNVSDHGTVCLSARPSVYLFYLLMCLDTEVIRRLECAEAPCDDTIGNTFSLYTRSNESLWEHSSRVMTSSH